MALDFAYEQTDIPPGMSHAEWRRARARRAQRHRRRRRRRLWIRR